MIGNCDSDPDFDIFDRSCITTCHGCVVKAECLALGKESRSEGVWGGKYLNAGLQKCPGCIVETQSTASGLCRKCDGEHAKYTSATGAQTA